MHNLRLIFKSLVAIVVACATCGTILCQDCKYQYHEKDPLTEVTVFLTKPIKLSKSVKKQERYKVKGLELSYEKGDEGYRMHLEFEFTERYDQTLLYNPSTDSLYAKFDDGSIITLPIVKTPNFSFEGPNLNARVELIYGLNEAFIDASKNDRKVTLLRVGGSNFDVDFTELEADLMRYFRDCSGTSW